MMRVLTIACLFGLCSCASSIRNGHEKVRQVKTDQDRVASTIEQLSASNIRLFLFSLNPDERGHLYSENTKKVFHGFAILGNAEIASERDKRSLLNAFSRGVSENCEMAYMCFKPRHGLQIIDGTATNDFVICYECLSVRPYGFNSNNGFYTSGSPKSTFNEFVTKYHLEKATAAVE